MSQPPSLDDRPTVGVLWLWPLGAVVAFAWFVDASAIHRFQTSDSLIPVLVSLQKWTPYYWLQDRLGMLLPLLALPLRNPQSNLLAQNFLAAAGSAVAFLLAAIFAVGLVRGITLGALSLSIYLLTIPPQQQFFELLWQYQYGLSIALGLGGLLLLERWAQRWWLIAGAACISAAMWVNIGITFVLVPALVMRQALAGPAASLRRRLLSPRLLASLTILGAAFAVNLLASHKLGYALYYGVLSPKLWAACWGSLLVHAVKRHAFPTAWLVVLGCLVTLGLISLASATYRAGARRALGGAVCLLAGACGAWLMIGTVYATWYYHAPGRYMIPVALLAQVALAAGILAPWLAAASPARQRLAAKAMLLVLLLVVLAVYGTPSWARARRGIDQATGRYSDQVLAAGASHVIGEYWHVWPAVYHTNLLLYERGEHRQVWGITHRALETAPLWKAVPFNRTRLAAIAGDDVEVQRWIKTYHLPELIDPQALGPITIWVPRTALNDAHGSQRQSAMTAAVTPPRP
jgi:hypothetical protein